MAWTASRTSSPPTTPASSWSPFIGFNLDPYPAGVLEVVTDFVHQRDAGNGRATGAAERVPPNGISNLRNVGLVSIPGTGRREYVVAELRIPDADGPSLLTFRSGENAWVQRDVSGNGGWDWSGWAVPVHDVIAHGGNLWWVNLDDGLIGGDPLDVDQNGDAVRRYVVLPPELYNHDTAPAPESIEHIRMVSVSHRKVRCVAMTRLRNLPATAVEISVWTLVQRPALSWKPRCTTSLGEIWDHKSYQDKDELTEQVPVLAFLHPADPDVVYFFLGNYLFGVDVRLSEVVDFLPVQHGMREVMLPFSSRHVLAWMLPNSLDHALEHEYMNNEHYPADSDDEFDIPDDDEMDDE